MALYRSCVLSIFSDLLRLIYPCVTLSFRILFSGQLRICFSVGGKCQSKWDMSP